MKAGSDPERIKDATCVCRCEEIDAGQIRAAIADGAVSVNDVKRRTRAGMGLCQGIFCVRTITAMIHVQAGAPLHTLEPMTARPPTRVIPLALVADSDA